MFNLIRLRDESRAARKKNSEALDRSELGAIMIEAIVPILIFFVCLIFIFELCRFLYMSLTAQFVVARVAREASLIGVAEDSGTNQQCCEARVAALKQIVADEAKAYFVSYDLSREVFICDPESNDCNICDEALPAGYNFDPSNGPGFSRNHFLEVKIEKEMGFVFFSNLYKVKRRALTKAEGGLRDCPL
jgi:hypothetical protein